MPEAAHARLVADGARAGLAERDADVFDRVVRVDVQVTLGVDLEIEHAVARDLVEHVLEERQGGWCATCNPGWQLPAHHGRHAGRKPYTPQRR